MAVRLCNSKDLNLRFSMSLKVSNTTARSCEGRERPGSPAWRDLKESGVYPLPPQGALPHTQNGAWGDLPVCPSWCRSLSLSLSRGRPMHGHLYIFSLQMPEDIVITFPQVILSTYSSSLAGQFYKVR